MTNDPGSGLPPAEADPFRRFRRGEPEMAARAAGNVRRIINSRAYVIPERDRPDIVQQTMLDVWRVLADDNDVTGDFDGLVCRIAHRRCVDWVRRRRTTVDLDDVHPSDSGDPEVTAHRTEQVRLGRRILARLSSSCAELIRLRLFEDESYSRIAGREGRSEGAVRNQMYKCLNRARKVHQEIEEDTGQNAARVTERPLPRSTTGRRVDGAGPEED